MPDVFTKIKRSEVMSLIRGKGNRDTELRLIHIFKTHGITGWRRNAKLPGKPDFIFRTKRLALFVDGCYWHGCPKHFSRPKTNQAFWDAKIARNRQRDHEVNRILKAKDWRVLRIWEHALTRKNEQRTVSRIERALLG